MAYTAPRSPWAIPQELVWFMVAIPDHKTYRRAAMDAYTNLANRWAWGEETEDEYSDLIQQQWLTAISATLEAYEMGFPTNLLGLMDDMIALLTTLQNQGCCNDNITHLPTQPIPNPEGRGYDETPPDTWGDGEEVVDVDDWHDLLCGAAHDWVDLMIYQANQMDGMIITSLLTVGVIASILGALATAGLSMLITSILAGAIFTGVTAAWTEDMFSDAADGMETNRMDIICAILSGSVSAVEDALEAAMETPPFFTFFKWVDIESAINTMLYGEANGAFMEPRRGETCTCDEYTFDLTFTFDTDQEGWAMTNGVWDSDSGEGAIKLSGGLAGMKLFYGDEGIPGRGLMDALGLTHPQKFIVELVKVRVRTTATGSGMNLYLQSDDGSAPLHETLFAGLQTTSYTDRFNDDLAGWDEYTTVSEFDNRRVIDIVIDPIDGTNEAYITSVRVAGQVEAG